MAGKLARVRWEMGQTLLPEHLEAQEESLLADSTMRFRISGLPAYGIAALQWSDALLRDGVLSILSLMMVMPSGRLLSARDNAVVSPFNLNTPGTVDVPVYCHLTEAPGMEDNLRRTSAPAMEATDFTVEKRSWRLELSSEPTHPEALETLKIADFLKDPSGEWHFSPSYIPPLLQVGTSPFLRRDLEELSQMLDPFQERVAQEIAMSYLVGDSTFSAKECLRHTLDFRRFTSNVMSRVHPHPYFVYEALKQFYSRVCFYRDSSPEFILDLYDHDQLGDCFKRIFEPLRQQLLLAHGRSPYIPFDLKDGLYRLTLPSDLREAKEVYLLVQKSHTNMKANLEGFKMASLTRLPLVHKLALQGVPVRMVERPPFHHRFGPEVDFLLILEGNEWDQALRDLTLGFYESPRYHDLRFYLFWRTE